VLTGLEKLAPIFYADKELDEKRTYAKFAQVQTEGGREVRREVEHYNLDVVKQSAPQGAPQEFIIHMVCE
jgi:hypothetical protein